jgi:Glycosyltransferase family 87
MFFAPFARLPYMVAASIWIVASFAVYGLCCALLWMIRPSLRPYPGLVALTSLALPALYGLIAAGQTSSFALLWFTLAYLALRADRPWLAGLCLGTLVYKPTLVMVFPLLFLFANQWRILLAVALAAGLQFAIAGMYFGWPMLVDYVRTLAAGVSAIEQLESQPWQMNSLRALFANSLPWPSVAFALQVVSSLAVIVFAIRVWRSNKPLSLRYAILVIATALVSPHVYTYELVILVPAYLTAAEMAVEQPCDRRRLWPALLAAACLPGLSLIMNSTYVQWSTLAIVWLMIVLWRTSIKPSERAHAQEAVA